MDRASLQGTNKNGFIYLYQAAIRIFQFTFFIEKEETQLSKYSVQTQPEQMELLTDQT